jgi:ElaB/YqjD/DUF883 family membrane-anchored ribosome-binding protein
MELNRTAEELFLRSQDLLMPDELDGESGSHYTPGSASRHSDPSVSDMMATRSTLPRTRDFEANLFLRSQDLLEPDELDMESSQYEPGSATRSHGREKWRSKLAALKSRGFERVGSMRDQMTGKVSSARAGVNDRVAGANRNMRSHPAKWAGIAAGAGVGLGLMSRLLRARRRRQLPDLILIETC